MQQEQRRGSVVKHPKGILRVTKAKNTGQRNNFVTAGAQSVLNVVKKATAGRNTNVLQVQAKKKVKEKDPNDFYKNIDDIPPERRAKPSLRDVNSVLEVSADTGE